MLFPFYLPLFIYLYVTVLPGHASATRNSFDPVRMLHCCSTAYPPAAPLWPTCASTRYRNVSFLEIIAKTFIYLSLSATSSLSLSHSFPPSLQCTCPGHRRRLSDVKLWTRSQLHTLRTLSGCRLPGISAHWRQDCACSGEGQLRCEYIQSGVSCSYS